jgi:hypothetical protein
MKIGLRTQLTNSFLSSHSSAALIAGFKQVVAIYEGELSPDMLRKFWDTLNNNNKVSNEELNDLLDILFRVEAIAPQCYAENQNTIYTWYSMLYTNIMIYKPETLLRCVLFLSGQNVTWASQVALSCLNMKDIPSLDQPTVLSILKQLDDLFDKCAYQLKIYSSIPPKRKSKDEGSVILSSIKTCLAHFLQSYLAADTLSEPALKTLEQFLLAKSVQYCVDTLVDMPSKCT